ncbi:MAG TPA: hypothetical protein VM238_13460 [Phycisphaerae bacterium]|nr:hypothetical protein [Phycisphaerae bacterium]
MKPRLPKSASVFVSRELITSRAFLSLTGKAAQVLMVFLTKRRVEKLKRPDPRGNRFQIVNNGELEFTYLEALRLYGLTSKTFRHAIDNLVRVGFLDITKHGGGLEGDRTRYGLSQRWRHYGTAEFQPAERLKGRPWPARATAPKGRAPTSLEGRGSPPPTALEGRGLALKPTGTTALEGRIL